MRLIGLFLSRLRRWQLSCHLLLCRISPQICAPVAGPPVCVSPFVSVFPTRIRPLGVFLTGLWFLFVFVSFHFVKSFLPFLVVLFTLCFALALAFALTRLAFALALILFGFALARLAFGFCRPCQTIHKFGCLACIQFSFDNLSPCGRKFHTTNSFFGIFDFYCPLPTNPSEQAVCFFVLIQRFRSLSQILSILSCQQC